jgi:propanol-preferring alcohol dehydrogenase
VVGEVIERGSQANTREIGARVGVAWIYLSDEKCEYCQAGEENLCPNFKATGRDADGGYAEYMVVPAGYTYPIPKVFSDAQAAPHLCAGAVGYRSLRLTGLENRQRLGLTGFGASGHLVLKMVRERFPDTDIFVFSRNPDERQFARDLGAAWAGEIGAESPEKLHAIIDTTPVWKPVVEALKNLAPGGRLVINAIRKESVDQQALLDLDYSTHLWMEKEIKSVANVTRRDVQEFLELAAQVPILPEVQEFALEDANQALLELKTSKIRGAKVLYVA